MNSYKSLCFIASWTPGDDSMRKGTVQYKSRYKFIICYESLTNLNYTFSCKCQLLTCSLVWRISRKFNRQTTSAKGLWERKKKEQMSILSKELSLMWPILEPGACGKNYIWACALQDPVISITSQGGLGHCPKFWSFRLFYSFSGAINFWCFSNTIVVDSLQK